VEKQRPKFKAGAELKSRVMEAASQLFAEEGYQNVSIRRIAEVAGCSVMAMYRHYPDKASLIRHICVERYTSFITQLHNKLDLIEDPKDRLLESARRFIDLSVKNPHHYRLTYLTVMPDEDSVEIRTAVANPAIEYFRKNLRLALPQGTPEEILEEKLRLCFACMHGLVIMLITYPRPYGVTRQKAFHDFESLLNQLVGASREGQLFTGRNDGRLCPRLADSQR
jgi:AcrR family transcriptional regulator